MRVVGQSPRIWNHCSVGAYTHRLVVILHRERIGLAVKVSEAHVVECCRSMLLVARVCRNKEEGTIVETVTLVLDSSWGVYIWWSQSVLQISSTYLSSRLVTTSLASQHFSLTWGYMTSSSLSSLIGERLAIRTCHVKLVIPLAFHVSVEMRIVGLVLFVMHQLVNLRRRSCFEIGLV